MPSDAVVEGVSGAIGGIIATIATYPLQTIQTRQVTTVSQQKSRPSASTSIPTTSAPTSQQTQHDEESKTEISEERKKSTLEELIHIVSTSGWRSLFPGIGASLVGTTASQGVYFYLYSILRQAAVRRRLAAALADARSADITVGESLFVAALAGMGNVLLTNPIWMIATRMQAHKKLFKHDNTTGNGTEEAVPAPGPVAVAREVYHEYGISGFWNGVGASLVMVINPTLQYAFYEWLLKVRSRVRAQKSSLPPRRPTAMEVFLLSAVAKAAATVLTYPMLTVKTRMMSARKSDSEMQYKSITDAITQISRKQGLGGFYQGIRTKIVQSVFAAALLFMCKEKITDITRDVLLGEGSRQKQKGENVVAVAIVSMERK